MLIESHPVVCLPFAITFTYDTAQSVKQISGNLTVAEGKSLPFCCFYEIQFSNIVFTYWYIQYPGQLPKLLLRGYGNVQGFPATPHKGASQLKDSAVYFCVIRDTMRSYAMLGSGRKEEW
uniref:Immunoglobulin V-set domain-containing protein n=1 Tax=Laticauda laticaudata TaxID=8630 RepID=A0A8C5RWD9_LATLA